MVLPFQPVSMSFSNVNYFVDVPLVRSSIIPQMPIIMFNLLIGNVSN